MSGIRAFAIVAAMGLIVASGVVPALADDVARTADEAVAKEVVVSANDIPERVRAPEAVVVAPALATPPVTPARPKAVRAVRASPARAAVAPQQHWNCSGYWCGRQFVLMLGIGY
jgi:hypothetical protein